MDTHLLYKVCRMYYFDDLTQQAIGDRLGVSRMTVARLLSEARRAGYVEIKLQFLSIGLSDLEREIERRFGIRECAVVPAGENTEQMLSEMAVALADILDRCLKGKMIVGCSWGTTLEAMARHLKPKRKYRVQIVPIVGAVGLEGSGSYTNYVTRGFAEKLGGINYTINVPAVVNSQAEKAVLEKVSNTQKIIDLASRASVLLVGASDATIGSSLGRSGNFTQEEIDFLQGLGIIGNTNLVFINPQGEHVQNRVEDRILRILEPEAMKRAKTRILIAFGASKIKVITAAMRGGWINTIITEEETARRIMAESE